MRDFAIGTLNCPPGTKARGSIQSTHTYGVDGSLPFGLVNGIEDGPVLAVVAGIHGCEYAGIEAASRLHRDLDPSRLRGSVVVVPVANRAAFSGRVAHLNPIDGLNLNRVFPGDGGRTMTYRIARSLMQDVALRSDALVDLHGADLGEAMVPCVTALTHEQGKGDAVTSSMAAVYGTQYVRSRPAASSRGTFVGEVRARGIPAITCELGAGGLFEEGDIDAHGRGMHHVMSLLGMVEGAPKAPASQRHSNGEELIIAEQGGVFHPRVAIDSKVRAGDVVADITDEWGTLIERHQVEQDGVVRLIFLRRVVQPGNPLLATMLFS